MNKEWCVGIDISAERVTMTWGKTLEDEQPVLEFEQNAIGHRRLIHQLTQTGYAPRDCLVVMEATGTYWMRLAHTLHDAGFVVSVVNPVQAHHLAQAQLQRAKTDQIDACLLMELAFRLQPTPWSPPPALATILYQCLCQRDALLDTRTQVRNRLHALRQSPEVFATILNRYEAHIAFLNQQVKVLDQEIHDLLQSDP